MTDKRDQLYDNLIGTGRVTSAEIGTREAFKSAIHDEQTARKFHENLLGSGIFSEDEIGNADAFYGSIKNDFAPTTPEQEPQQIAQQPTVVRNTSRMTPASEIPSREQKTKQPNKVVNMERATPISEKPKPFVPRQESFEDTLKSVRQTSANVDRAKNAVRYQQAKSGFDTRTPELSLHNRNVVEAGKEFNPKTGQIESRYITESGNEYGEQERGFADLEQTNIDRQKVEDAHKKEMDDLLERIEAKKKELANAQSSRLTPSGMFGQLSTTDREEALQKEYDDLTKEYARRNWEWNENSGVNQTALHQLDELDSSISKGLSENEAPRMSTTGTGPGVYTPQKGSPRERELFSLASQSQQETRDILNAADAYQRGRNFFGGAAAGIRDAVSKVGTWDLGITNLASSVQLTDITKKLENDQPLTEGEQALLDATILNLYVSAAYGGQLGYGYEAGKVTGESLPFMAEMIANPLSGTGNALAKRFGKAIAKRYAGSAARRTAVNVAKTAGHMFGDVIGAAGMAGTTGLPRVLSGAVDRNRGEIQFQTSDGGSDRIIYGGTGDGMSFGKALAKSFGSVFTENHSELLGEYFAPILGLFGRGVSGGLNKVGLKSVNEFFDGVSKTDLYKLISHFEKRAKWNGTIGEFAEEVAGDIEKYILNTDNVTFDTDENTGIFNGENMLKTFLGVSLMGGFFSAVKTAGYRGEKGEARANVDKYDSQGASAFGPRWAEIRNALTFGSDETAENTLLNIINSDEYSHEQKLIAERYAGAQSRYKGFVMGERKLQDKQGQLKGVEASRDSYENGLMAQGADRNAIGKQARDASQVLNEQTGGADVVQEIDLMIGTGALADDVEQYIDGIAPELQPAAQAYAQASFGAKGVWDGAQIGINTQVEQREQELMPAVVEGENGRTITMGTLADGQEVLVIMDDGDNAIIYQNGKKSQVKSRQIQDAQTYDFDNVMDNYRRSLEQSASNEAEFVLNNNQHTQMPSVGLELHNGEDTYQITGINPSTGAITATKVKLDKTGQLVPDGGALVTLTQQDVLDLQNQYYDELEARQRGTQAQEPVQTPVEEQNTPATGANVEQPAQEAPQQDADLAVLEQQMASVNPEAQDYIDVVKQQIDEFGSVQSGFYDSIPQNLVGPLQQYAEAYSASKQQLQPVEENTQETITEQPVADETAVEIPRDGDGDIDIKAIQKTGNSQLMTEALLTDFDAPTANATAQQYLTEAIKAQEKEKNPVKKNGSKKKAVDFWREVVGMLNEATTTTEAPVEEQTETPETDNILEAGNAAKEKWDGATKIDGNSASKTLPSGQKIKGHFVLVEEGSATPSHSPSNFKPSEGFPVTAQGQNANSRDYENDRNAQASVQQMGASYDGRAIDDMPVVSAEGIVWSGNNRVMSGQLAAQNGTDQAYTEALADNASMYGFTPEQVTSMAHPRVYFVPDAGQGLDYTPQTFNLFNAPREKEEGGVSKGVKMGKVLNEHTFNLLSQEVARFGSLANVYKSPNACREIIRIMQDADEIVEVNQQTLPRYIGTDGLLTEDGQNLLNSALVGYMFRNNAEVLGYLESLPKSAIRQMADAMPELVANARMGELSLSAELAEAVKALYQQQQSGQSLDEFMRQYDLFEGKTLYGETTRGIVEAMMGQKGELKALIDKYNTRAEDVSTGQLGMFGNDTRESILRDVLGLAPVEQEEQPTAEEEQPTEEEQPSEDIGSNTQTGLTDEETESLIEAMKARATTAPVVEITDENWKSDIETPLGKVKMGENQREKLFVKGREEQYGMLLETLSNPDIVLEEYDTQPNLFHERPSSYIFVKTFQKPDGTKYIHFESVTVQQGEMEVSVSSHIIRENQLRNKLKSDRLLYKATALDESAPSSAEQPINEVSSPSSADKGSEENSNAQENGEKNVSSEEETPAQEDKTDILADAKRIAEEEERKKAQEKAENSEENSNFVLTLEALEASDLDETIKSGARAWLNGDKTPGNQIYFIAAQDYVRNLSTNFERGSEDAGTAQLGGEDNGTTDGRVGRSNGASGRVDSTDNGEGVSADGSGRTDSTSDVAGRDGAQGDTGVSGQEPVDDNGSASGRTGRSSGNRSQRSNGRRSGQKGGKSVSGTDAVGDARARAQAEVDSALEEFKKILGESITDSTKGKLLAVDPITLYAALGAQKALKLLPVAAKLAYWTAKLGYYNFSDWFKALKDKLGSILHETAGLTEEQIDSFIEMMWDYSYSIDGVSHKVSEWAGLMSEEELRNQMAMSLEEKRKLQAAAEKTETKVDDLANIRESLPFLLPKQQEDVQKAEHQFFDESHKDAAHGHGKGYMFTNGTGTGKTYTGLGIVKRFLKQGKKRILIVTAQETKIKDWIRDAKNLGIEASMLPDTSSKGEGVVVTQYANIRQNMALLEDEFDLIVYDESHKLMENQDGSPTSTSRAHHMLSNRDERQAARRALMRGELGKRYADSEKELDLLTKALNTPTTEWTDEVKKAYLNAGANPYDVERRQKELKNFIEKFDEIIEKEIDNYLANPTNAEEARKAVEKTKVVFLSATPFNTPANLDYAEGYIFSYTNTDDVIPDTKREAVRGNFLVEKFGASHARNSKNQTVSRIPQERIPDPMKASEEEVSFSDYMQTELNTMSGRDLDSEYDYSREFPKLDFAEADMFNDAIQSLSDGRFNVLAKYFDHLIGDYNTMTGYLEIFKANMIAPRIREYIALGKKVSLYHRRKASNVDMFPPFALAMEKAKEDKDADRGVESAINAFKAAFPRLFTWEQTINYMFPQESLLRSFMTKKETDDYTKALEQWHKDYDEELRKLRVELFTTQARLLDEGDEATDIKKKISEINKAIDKIVKKYPKPKCAMVAVFNGTETEKTKEEAVNRFNNDEDQTKLFIAQVQAGKEGISLHDTSGKYPRVQIGIFLPQSPIEFIQTEGRIFRVGNRSNAIFEYPLLGLDIELGSFALKINGRSETTENLALGSRGRGLKESISRAALASRSISPQDAKGIGGKELDNRTTQKADGFDAAMQNYAEWQGEAKPEDINEVEIPDPIGYMMVQLARPENGERVFVPNARRGSIARYVPSRCRMTAMEARNKEFARLTALIGGSGRKILNEDFSNHSINNKYDIVVLNTAHGDIVEEGVLMQGAGTMDRRDVDKAFRHLDDSGRVVALVKSDDIQGIRARLSNTGFAVTTCEIKLPDFVLNGTPSTIIIADRIENKQLRSTVGETTTIDLSNAKDEASLFAQLRSITSPERKIDKGGRIARRLRTMTTPFINTGCVAKTRDYHTNKMVPDVYMSANYFRVSFSSGKMAYLSGRNAYRGFYINIGDLAKGDTDEIMRLANDWVTMDTDLQSDDNVLFSKYQYYISYKRDRLNGVRDCLRAMMQSIELALGKTPMQIRNIAAGKVENEIGGAYDLRGFREIFDSLNPDDAGLEALAIKVFDAVSKINGIKFSVVPGSSFRSSAGHNVMAHYVPSRNIIELNGDLFNSIRTTDLFKAQTIVHEMIHAVTCWAIDTYKNESTRSELTKEQQEACKNILDIYAQINNDDVRRELRKNSQLEDNAEYGLTNEYEMMAELANPVFRAILKAKKLWRQIINGIEMLLGIEIPGVKSEQSDALTILDNALETLMDGFNPDLYSRYTSGEMESGWENEAPNNPADILGVAERIANRSKETAEDGVKFSAARPTEQRQDPVDILEEASRIARENERRKPLRERAKTWAKVVGVKINLIERESEINDSTVLEALREGDTVKGWFNPRTGEVYIYLPHTESEGDIDRTILHEVVAHKGLRELLGENEYGRLCDLVFAAMSEKDKKAFLSYPGVDKLSGRAAQRAAADEYMAHVSETLDLEPSVWKRIVEFVRHWLRDRGINLSISDGDIETALRASLNSLMRNASTITTESDAVGYTRLRRIENSAPIFISNARKAVEEIKQDKATPEQWLAMITKNGGLKAGEDKWLGLSDWLKSQDKKTLTKQEVLDYIRENQIEVQEVSYADETLGRTGKHWDYLYDWLRDNTDAPDAWFRTFTDICHYVDGEGFRLNQGVRQPKVFMDMLDRVNNEIDAPRPSNGVRLGYTTRGLDNRREIALVVPTIESWNESDQIHFGDAGDGRAVAWIRFGDAETRDPDAEKAFRDAGVKVIVALNDNASKEEIESLQRQEREARDKIAKRVLVIDEIQSKRHQEGREKGYAPSDKEIKAKRDKWDKKAKERDAFFNELCDKYGVDTITEVEEKAAPEEVDKYQRLLKEAKEYETEYIQLAIGPIARNNLIPDAPFEKNWHELAMKRMLRYAAENGYDKVAWTTGAQQADRYNLSSVVDHISYTVLPNGSIDARAYLPSGGYQPIGSTWEEVARNVGKDLAARMQKGEKSSTETLEWGIDKDNNPINREYKVLRGDNLKIGGEGMRGFYDQMLPSFMNKYGKKWGAKVEDIPVLGHTMHSVDVTPEMKESVMQGQTMFRRTSNPHSGNRAVAQNSGSAQVEYEATLKGIAHRMRETWQDSMLSLKALQNAITKETGRKLLDSQNAWMAENRLSSMNAAQQEEFRRIFMTPLLDAIRVLGGADKQEYERIKKYMIAKHGIERNQVFAQRDGISEPKDYSGLTSLFHTDDVKEAERLAQEYVDQFEAGREKETDDLWDAVKGVSSFALRKSLDTGMVSQETYDTLLDQFDYYIPLRGWDETTSDEVYDYIGRQETPVANVIKRAYGRTSVADDPLATLQNLAESAIIAGNRNMVKQHFLNLATMHKTGLVSVSGLWLKYDDLTGTWDAVFPDIDDNDTPEEVASKTQKFNERMEALAKSDPTHYKRQNEKANIPYRIKPDALRNHRVLVKQGGRTYVLTVNGNPRAAQALNGLTNPDAGSNVLTKAVASGSRWIAAWATAKNVGFIASNLVRDGLYVGPMSFLKEGGEYGARYTANWWACLAQMPFLLRKLSNGTLDNSNPNSLEAKFYDFVHNGGETGYTIVNDVEACKKYLNNELHGNIARDAWGALNDVLQFIGRWSEGISRFAAYRTSLEMGRSKSRAIYDAKDISVNFSKKGSGMSTAGKWENASTKDKFIYTMASLSQQARAFYSFFNASVQGLENISRVSWHNKGKALGLFGGLMAMGAGQAFINSLTKSLIGGDDDDNYYNLPEWQRSSNFILYLGKYWPGGWMKLPLPIEFGVPFGLGVLLAEYTDENSMMSEKAFGLRFAQQIGKAMPLDPTSEDSYFNTKALWPTIARPLAEVSDNTSWTGLPIARQYDWNKYDPEYKRVYKNAGAAYVKASKAVSEATGGTPGKRGSIEVNPQKMEYLVKQYLGGGYNWFSRPSKLTQDVIGSKDFEWQDVPVLYRFTTTTDQRAVEKRINSQFYDLKNEMDARQHEYNTYKKAVTASSKDPLELAKATAEFQDFAKSPEYTEYIVWHEGDKQLEKIKKDAKNGANNSEDEFMMKQQMLDAVREYRATKDTKKAFAKYTQKSPN